MNSINKNSSAIISYINQTPKNKISVEEHLRLYERESPRLRMELIMNNSFKAHFKDYSAFDHYGRGDIVVLVGTSTAGKTSIIKALQQLEPDRMEDGVDLTHDAINLDNLKKYCPFETEILIKAMKNPIDIPKTIYSTERYWKIGISVQEKIEAEKAILDIVKKRDAYSPEIKENEKAAFRNIEFKMIDKALDYSRRGGNIIFDVLDINAVASEVLARNFDGPVRVVLAYCPFHELSSRMEKRNKEAVESGELSNQRIGAFPLRQFGAIFTKKEMGQSTYERLTREQVTKSFDENFDNGIDAARAEGHPLPSDEQILKDKEKERAELLTDLGFKKGIDEVEIAPKNQHFYHSSLDTSVLSPEDSAKIIHNGTYERYK